MGEQMFTMKWSAICSEWWSCSKCWPKHLWKMALHNFRTFVWISRHFTHCSLQDYHRHARLSKVLCKMGSTIMSWWKMSKRGWAQWWQTSLTKAYKNLFPDTTSASIQAVTTLRSRLSIYLFFVHNNILLSLLVSLQLTGGYFPNSPHILCNSIPWYIRNQTVKDNTTEKRHTIMGMVSRNHRKVPILPSAHIKVMVKLSL
jgi:hypothetical protein